MSIVTELDELFVSPVKGHDDVVAFRFPFQLEGKAEAQLVTTLDDGDLLISGFAAVFEGEDRQNENFAPGAFQKGIQAFLQGNHSLCWHHKNDIVLGEVTKLEEVEGKGLYMEARVDSQPESSPHRWIYNAIKKGSAQGLSVGGWFKRAVVDGRQRIVDMDFSEISATAVPVHNGTRFSVIAGKALTSETVDQEDFIPDGLQQAVASLAAFADTFEAKALPKSHDPQTASFLSDFIGSVARTRQLCTALREISDNDSLTSLADEVETATSKWEADGHKIAAKIGPLPPPPQL